MNERIKELLAQCTQESIDGPFASPYVNQEKFAQLLINDCIDVVIASDPSAKLILHEPYRTIMTNIVNHFGIEE